MNRSRPEPAKNREDPIARGLKRLFDEVASEPLPEEFLRILDEIDEQRAAEPRQARRPDGD